MNIEDLDNALIQALDMETNSLFLQGDCIIAGIEAGLPRKTVYGRFCHLARRAERTAKQRHKTSAIFPPDKRDPQLNWSFHSYCASVADLRKPETWQSAYDWLERAASTIADNREYSLEDLAMDMKASGHDPEADKPLYIADKVVATIVGANSRDGEITLRFKDTALFANIQAGMIWNEQEFIVTLVQKVALDLSVDKM